MKQPAILSRLLSVAFVLYGVGCLLVWWLPPAWLLQEGAAYQLQVTGQGMPALALNNLQRLVGSVSCLPALAALWLAFRQLALLLSSFAQCAELNSQTTAYYRRFCGWLMVGLVLTLLEGVWRSVGLYVIDASASKLTLAVDISGGDLLAIGIAALFYLLHRVMAHSARLQQENSEFI